MATPIESKFVWVFFKNYIKAGHHRLATDLAHEVERVLPTMTLEAVRDLLAEAPSGTQRGLWKLWVNQADLSGYTLTYLAEKSNGLSPSAFMLIWCAWVQQADLSQYSYSDFEKLRLNREFPYTARRTVVQRIEELWPHLRMPQIRVINQLGSGRR